MQESAAFIPLPKFFETSFGEISKLSITTNQDLLKVNFNNLKNAKIALIKKFGGGILIDVLSIKSKSYLFRYWSKSWSKH